MSINPKSVEFHQCHAKHIRFAFFFTISRITKENFAKICWQLKTPTRTWKCTRCIMQISYLYASDFPFKNFCKIAQHKEQYEKNVWEKSNDAYSLSIRVQTAINHISIFTFLCFFTKISTSKKMFSFRARAKKGITRHTDASSVVWIWLVRSEHAHASYPGLFFRPPGFSPYMGREERRVQGLD